MTLRYSYIQLALIYATAAKGILKSFVTPKIRKSLQLIPCTIAQRRYSFF